MLGIHIAKAMNYIFIAMPVSLLILLSSCGGDSGLGFDSEQSPDPVVVDYPLLYVERDLPRQEDQSLDLDELPDDLRRPDAFFPGARLIFRDRASAGAPAKVLTAGLFESEALYDVKDLSSSYDGHQLLFALRAPDIEDADDDEQPKWNIWLFDNRTQVLTPVINSSITAEAGHDINPSFLPDGRIIFASTRQRQSKAILLDEGKPQYAALEESRRTAAFSLHIMNIDGSDIKQVSFNPSHDLAPQVLPSGKVTYSRWDNMGNRSSFNLYTMNPDGSENEILYGWHSHDSDNDREAIQFSQATTTDSGQLLIQQRRQTSPLLGSEFYYLNWQQFSDINQTIAGNDGLESAVELASFAQTPTSIIPMQNGRILDMLPLFDDTGRMIIAWSPCRLIQDDAIRVCNDEDLAAFESEDSELTEAEPLYGLWIYDPKSGTQKPIVKAHEV